MMLDPVRRTCGYCEEVLPRAALNRCPLCLEPIPQCMGVAKTVCRTCQRPIPRAHAGKCPSCAAAYLHKAGKAITGGNTL